MQLGLFFIALGGFTLYAFSGERQFSNIPNWVMIIAGAFWIVVGTYIIIFGL